MIAAFISLLIMQIKSSNRTIDELANDLAEVCAPIVITEDQKNVFTTNAHNSGYINGVNDALDLQLSMIRDVSLIGHYYYKEDEKSLIKAMLIMANMLPGVQTIGKFYSVGPNERHYKPHIEFIRHKDSRSMHSPDAYSGITKGPTLE